MKWIVFILLLIAATGALALDLHVGNGQTYATVDSAVAYAKTNAGPHTIWVHPGTYTNINCTGLTGTVRSISGELSGPQSAQDTIIYRVGTSSHGVNLGPTVGNTLMGVTVDGSNVVASASYQLIGNFDWSFYAHNVVNCRIRNGRGSRMFGPLGTYTRCLVENCGGTEVFRSCTLNSCQVSSSYGGGIYGGIVYVENNVGGAYNCTIVGSTNTGNYGIINRYNSTLTTENNAYQVTNLVYSGTITSKAGDISNSATFYSAPVGYGIGSTAGDLRIRHNSAGWNTAVRTAAMYFAAASNTAYDLLGRPWRTTNGPSGCYAESPHDQVQMQGLFIP